MSCSKTRTILFSSQNDKIAYRNAMVHLNSCEKCAKYFDNDKHFEQLLKEAIVFPAIPPHSREKILAAIAKKESKKLHSIEDKNSFFTFHRNYLTYALVTLVFMLFLTIPLASSFKKSPWVKAFIGDHIEYLPVINPEQIHTSSQEELRNWFESKVPFLVKAPILKNATLTGGRLCYLKGGKSALLFYELLGRRLSMFIMNDEQDRFKGVPLQVRSGQEIYIAEEEGMNLIGWKEDKLNFAIVSDLEPNTLLKSLLVY